jgi:Domain of Unknown Function with PDB structure (DUF3858)
MRSNRTILFICLIACLQVARAQEKTKYKFGEIGAADFQLSAESYDSGANAVILKDIGSSRFDGNDRGFFTLVYTRYVRVKIMNKNGFDVGNYLLDLYHDLKDREIIYSIRGSTFNLEKGIITETKLDTKSVYLEKYSRNYDRTKFSMPGLKEGAIYDLEYVIKSPFYGQLRSWSFQGEYPCLWSEYVVTLPPPFHYMIKQQGDDHFDIKTVKDVFQTFTIREDNAGIGNEDNGAYQKKEFTLKGSSIEQRWVKKNVPSIHEEPYTTSLVNYYSRVSFQLNYFQWTSMSDAGNRHDFLESWSSLAKDLLQDENFGLALSRVNVWMTDELKTVVQKDESQEIMAHKIYEYVRNNFKTVKTESHIESNVYANNLKDVFNKKEGSVAEINLILTAMLRHEGILADPLILSTRSHGFASVDYPLIDDYNYVICVAFIDGGPVPLDASHHYNDFGQLPIDCYNGFGHIMNVENPIAILFTADSINEASITSVFVSKDEKGITSCNLKTTYGINGSYDRRKEIINTSEIGFEQKIQSVSGPDLVIENFGIDSLYKFKFPLGIHYDVELKSFNSAGDILYFNPMFTEGLKSNPFKSMIRRYPVEMPYKMDETYLLSLEMPEGYQVDEMPKSVRVAYNGNEGFFEYLIQKGENNIQMRVHLKLNKAFFPVEEYPDLRDFFAFVVKKESEQIVFKKIK